MICRGQMLGLVLISLGIGLLAGALLPSCLLLWLLSFALIAAGVFLFQC